MTFPVQTIAGALCAALMAWPGHAWADDLDALALESSPVTDAAQGDKPMRLYIEGAVGSIRQRYDLAPYTAKRVSVDFNYNLKLGGGWRATLSDRLDQFHPASLGVESTVNSLREAFVSWRDEGGSHAVELGRVNLRNGPAYGYNPTDYFRDGALRSVTSVDPFALRENRLGTAMLRYQQLWAGGSASFALAPKLDDSPNTASWNPDWGSTNHSNHALASWSGQFSDRFSGQALAYAEQDKGAQFGVNFTALVSDAVVGHFEASRGRDEMALSGSPATMAIRNRLAVGATYTNAMRTALTLEYEYNGFAPDRATWLAASPAALGAHLIDGLKRQETASRNAWMAYVTQKSLGWKNLDLTALLRLNADDNSRLGWLEVRYHWPNLDAALQWKASLGDPLTEYGLPPQRQSIQLLGAWFF